MAEVSQPSSLTLEPNPFEQSFASKAQEQSSQRGVDDSAVNDGAAQSRDPRHAGLSNGDHAASAGAAGGGVDKKANIPGIDKIMTPLPLIQDSPAAASGNSQQVYPLNVINVPNSSRWVPARQGPYTPMVGTPTFDGYIAQTNQVAQSHVQSQAQAQAQAAAAAAAASGDANGNANPSRPLSKAEKPPSNASSGNGQVPRGSISVPYAESFAANMGRPMPMESPGVLMPMPSNLMFSPVPSANPVLSPHPQPLHSQQPGLHMQPSGSHQQQQPHVGVLPQGVPPQPDEKGNPPRGVNTAANGLYLLSQDSLQPHQQQEQHQIDGKPLVVVGSHKSPAENGRSKSQRRQFKDPKNAVSPNMKHASLSPESPAKRSKSDISRRDSGGADPDAESKRLKADSATSINSAGSSSAGSSNADQDDNERRKMFLERNRIAAIKCRQRKKQWVDELKSKADVYSQLNQDLQRNNQKLKSDLEQMRQFVLSFHDMRSLPPNILNIVNSSVHVHNNASANPAAVNAQWFSHPQQHQHQHPQQHQHQQHHQQHQQQHGLEHMPGHMAGPRSMQGSYPQDLSASSEHHLQQTGQATR